MVQDLKTETGEKSEVDIDEALDIAGVGWYNLRYSLILALFLIAAIVEPIGNSYVLISAKCDLQMSESQRGFISSIPYIGIVLTSFPWGYAVDTRGRKKMVVLSATMAGFFGALSAFMPSIVYFAAMKFLMALCIACPAAIPFTFIGEILPGKYRDVTLTVITAMQMVGSSLVPLLAWAILPLDFSIDFGQYYFRPWRLLAVAYALPFLIGALLMSFGPESPKFVLSQGLHDESLEVKRLRMTTNFEEEKPSFIKSLILQSVPLLKPPFLKWMALIAVLLFGVYANINGLYIWLPDVMNRVLTGGVAGQTACDVIAAKLNESTTAADAVCVDTVDQMTFIINASSNLACAVIALGVSSTVKIIGKKNLMIAVFLIIGSVCVGINHATQQVLFAMLVSSFPLLGLTIGPVNAFAVQIFPTKLRGMAVSLAMMVGRLGAIIGMNVVGNILSVACEPTFYSFGGLLYLCGLLSFLTTESNKSAT